MNVRWSIATPVGRAGAIGLIAFSADSSEELEDAFAEMGIPAIPPGAVRVLEVGGVDRAVVARWSFARAELMPHGGVAVMRALADHVARTLGTSEETLGPRAMYPEAASEVEARMLTALAHAASPRAIDLLLDQPRRWAHHAEDPDRAPEDMPCADARSLSRLLEPPLVVALGPPNVGKSSLVNALAGRPLALEADIPGTTRDHVGAMLDLDGLVVRAVDTPGMGDVPGAGRPDADAAEIARRVAARADLILSCSDATSAPVPTPPAVAVLRVATRTDLGPPRRPADISTCVRTGEGIVALARAVRSALVPDGALADPRPWRFWARPPRDAD